MRQETKINEIAHTLLYEGYCLYPYRRNAIKNKKPVPFGVLFPPQYSSNNPNATDTMQTECIVIGNEVNIALRFLHLMNKTVYKFDPYATKDNLTPVDMLKVNDKIYESGWVAIERKVDSGSIELPNLSYDPFTIPFQLDQREETENLISLSNDPSGRGIRRQKNIAGELHIKASSLQDNNAWKLQVQVKNKTPLSTDKDNRDIAMEHSLMSTHIVLETNGGKFISAQDPPDKWKEQSATCKNKHTWPVLVDENDSVMLSSPIIIYDHPEINPDSPGNLFDSGEIEEYLMLHINMIPEEEKQRIAEGDEKMKAMLERAAQFTPAEFLKLHGEMKESNFEISKSK